MIKFTKEEISLCKQVMEKHRKDIEYGDWYWSTSHNKPLIVIAGGFRADEQKHFGVFKIWTISDCLEFFEEKGFNHIYGFIHFKDGTWTFTAENSIEDNQYKRTRGEKASTLLEACLKAVIEVLKNEKL